jgi:hypothetical protein
MKPRFLLVKFLVNWPCAVPISTGQHKVGEIAEVRDWIAKALVKRGIARLVEGESVKNEGEVVERKGIKNS